MKLLAALAVLGPALAGCLAPAAEPGGGPAETRFWAPCVHPWPCADGTEWPLDLTGPFERLPVEPLAVETTGGILRGYAFLPSVPEGVRVPAVLEINPYYGQCYFHNLDSPNCRPTPDSPARGTPVFAAFDDVFFFAPLVEAGFAYVLLSAPGTGHSEGCFDDYGVRTQRAAAEAIEAVAALPWSNGRVGMMGLSSSGTTPFAAAIENPPSLKTIVPLGIQTNLYTFSASPQGALPAEGWFHIRYALSVSLGPAVVGAPLDVLAAPDRLPDRLCPDVVAYAASSQTGVTGDRDAAFWEPRMLVMRFPEVTTSVFVAQGFLDAFGSGHDEQEDAIWDTLRKAPKRMLLGQWEHEYPPEAALEGYDGGSDWWSVVLPWLDFWLKGAGEPPRLGVVDWQDGTGAWHASGAWPPRDARDEQFFLSAGTLAASGEGSPAEFFAGRSLRPRGDAFCGPLAGPATGVVFLSEPVVEPTLVAGNPYLHLRLASDAPGGIVQSELFDVGPDFACSPQSGASGITLLTAGAADLRYHDGVLVAHDFPVGTPTDVRIDLWNLAHVLEPGHRLAVVLFGPDTSYAEQSHFPMIVVHPESRLVLGIADGTLGGAAAEAGVPERPFLPAR